jgi:hypothetical protein
MGDALNGREAPRRRRPGRRESRRSWRGSLARCLSAAAHRRGPLPAPPLPRTGL